jgi:hypothetical protein
LARNQDKNAGKKQIGRPVVTNRACIKRVRQLFLGIAISPPYQYKGLDKNGLQCMVKEGRSQAFYGTTADFLYFPIHGNFNISYLFVGNCQQVYGFQQVTIDHLAEFNIIGCPD